MDKTINQNLIIKIISIALIIFSIIMEFISLDMVQSLIYCIWGILIGCITYIKSSKIRLFSPIYNSLVTIFFCYIFSSMYYYALPVDVMGNNSLAGQAIMNEINVIYSLFLFSVLLPIFMYIFVNKKSIKIKYFAQNLLKNDTNLKVTICNIIFFFFIILSFKYTSMSIFDAFLSSGEFRRLLSNGSISTLYSLIISVFIFVYILILKDIMMKTNYVTKYNKIILITEIMLWSFICGSKGMLIYNVIFPFVIIYTFFKKIRFKHIIVMLIGIIFIVTYSSLLNKFRVSGADMVVNGDYSSLKNIQFIETIAGRNDNFANSVQFFKKVNNGSLYIFNDFNFNKEITNQLLKPLPKYFRNKISQGDFDYFGTEFSKILYPDAVYIQHATFEFGIVANLFWCLGLFGVLIGGFLIGLFIIFIENLFNRYMYCDTFLVLYFCIFYSLFMSIFMVGIINIANTLMLLYKLPIILIIIYLFKKRISFIVK